MSDCSPANRVHDRGLDRRETGWFYPTVVVCYNPLRLSSLIFRFVPLGLRRRVSILGSCYIQEDIAASALFTVNALLPGYSRWIIL